WKFMALVHDKELRSGVITATAVTSKEIMIQPNPPRFLREGDTVEFTAKVTNQTDVEQKGQAGLVFADAATLAPVELFADDIAYGTEGLRQEFTLAPHSSQALSWKIRVPEAQGFLTYKAVAATSGYSD